MVCGPLFPELLLLTPTVLLHNLPEYRGVEKCAITGYKIAELDREGFDITAPQKVSWSSGVRYPSLYAIFDTTCSADPTIDAKLALEYLKRGGYVRMKDLKDIIKASRNAGYTELLDYLADTLGVSYR